MQSDKNWFLYIIQADDGSLYTGITTDVKRRFEQHKNADGRNLGAKFFRGRKPLQILHVETFATRSTASQREYEVKRMKVSEKRRLIDNTSKFKL